ncbi:MAG TPA: transcriptional regulator [Acidimicrobiales bacterium]|nr:transcriptional regulator [Acidimicrobiales bacterium]
MSEAADYRALSVLGEELRRSLFEFVRRAPRPVTREEAARASHISVKLAAFHLDKLVEHGLLAVADAAPGDDRRRVGRAPKRYTRSDTEVSLSLPARRYDLVGEILVDALVAGSEGRPAADTARRIAWERGREAGAAAAGRRSLRRPGDERALAAARQVLEEHGFEPAEAENGTVVLRNCPFHALAQRAPELVCGLNVDFVDGLLRGLGNQSVRAELQPTPGWCCVRLVPGRTR